MLKPRSRPDFGEKPFAAECGAKVGVKHFDGDVAVVFDITREIDSRHAALSELALNVVPSFQCFGKSADFVCQTPRSVMDGANL